MSDPQPPSRTKKWLKRIAFSLGVLLLLAVAAVALLIHGLNQPLETEVGGDWITSEPQSLVIEAGPRHRSVQRRHGRQRVVVEEDIFSIAYIGNDCVVFAIYVPGPGSLTIPDHASTEPRWQTKAACGDKPPILVQRSVESVWEYRLTDPIRINDKEFPWFRIRDSAQRGESLAE